ncbi:MAG: class I SAM-dependent methyltransferase [Xanthomonadales bacterium]|nr:class I SAM-dependent methyltransferase [Xanthomonadales bacterium]
MNATARSPSSAILEWTEQGRVPDAMIRAGIRRLCRQRLKDVEAEDIEASALRIGSFVDMMNSSPIALVPDLANEQHYEIPPSFFDAALGPHRKYSCCFWGDDTETLEQAEIAALKISCERAGIRDGMAVLDLGCGWGSLSLWIARTYPACHVTSVSNSAPQREFIETEAARRGLDNLSVITADMNEFNASDQYDRVVSVEMFEHMRNYRQLFARIHSWLKPGGQFFMHIFCHRSTPYEFLDQGDSDWMSRHFFSGGIMPSDDLPLHFQGRLQLASRFRWNGAHYERTSNAWLANMDERRDEIMPIMEATYGRDRAAQWLQRWRIFFMACAELFGLHSGREWFVSHYVFRRTEDAPQGAK